MKKNNVSEKTYLALKRILDIVLSSIFLVLLAPIFPLIGIVIKLQSKGPILFKQSRLGKGGNSIFIYKFRTMYLSENIEKHERFIKSLIGGDLGPNEKNSAVFKMKADPRITPFGRILRQTSLDEIPILFNVLKGDASIVGPRPMHEYMAEHVGKKYRRRFDFKPGITGLWQVSRKSHSFEEMLELDLKYIEEQSFLLDFRIILKTIQITLLGDNIH